MTKDNILFSIIGVLLGVIVGYVFATNLNRQGAARTLPTAIRASGEAVPGATLPENHPPLPPAGDDGAADQSVMSGADAKLVERAEAAPNDFEAQRQAAAMLYRSRRFDAALEVLTRANQLRPNDPEVLVALGNANFDTGRYETAEKWYTAALVKNPKDINVRTDLGLTYLLRAQPDAKQAIREFRRSLELDARHEQTLQNMVVALLKNGDLSEAEATLGKLREVNPGNQSLAKLASDLEEARRGSAAKQPANKGK